MAECEDLELKRGTAPEGSEKRGQKSGQQVPEGESKEKGQLPVYQSDRILREPQRLYGLFSTRRLGIGYGASVQPSPGWNPPVFFRGLFCEANAMGSWLLSNAACSGFEQLILRQWRQRLMLT
jgi:hypothetical protein